MRRFIGRAALACGVVTTLGCGGAAPACGYDVEVTSQAEWANAPDLRGRVDHVVSAAVRRWGGGPSALDGYVVVVEDDRPCDGALGCQQPGVIRVSRWTKYLDGGGLGGVYLAPCVEATALAHEVGHAIVGDPEHRDPRWRSGWDPLWDELVAHPGGCLPGLPYRGTWDQPEGD